MFLIKKEYGKHNKIAGKLRSGGVHRTIDLEKVTMPAELNNKLGSVIKGISVFIISIALLSAFCLSAYSDDFNWKKEAADEGIRFDEKTAYTVNCSQCFGEFTFKVEEYSGYGHHLCLPCRKKHSMLEGYEDIKEVY